MAKAEAVEAKVRTEDWAGQEVARKSEGKVSRAYSRQGGLEGSGMRESFQVKTRRQKTRVVKVYLNRR
jgi:hypothetical protein